MRKWPKSSLKKHHWLMLISAGLLVLLFITMRWAKITESLLFFNDMGRDYIVLLNWWETGKPPLLGPQTSVVSYNQSAWYFYFLFPLFALSNFSAVSSTATVTLFGVVIILMCLWAARNNRNLFWMFFSLGILLAVHPQMIIQNRFVWNPSFVPYFFLVSLLATIRLTKQYSLKWASIFWLSIAFAVGFSYSAIPLAGCISLYILFTNRKYWLQHVLIAVISAVVVLLPTIAFEIRYNFALTKLFFEGQSTPQEAYSFLIRLEQLIKLLFPAPKAWQTYIMFAGVMVSMILGIYSGYLKHGKNFIIVKIMAVLFFTLLLLQSALPINTEKHYIFPLLIALFGTISSLSTRFRVGIVCFMVIIWLQPYFIRQYIAPPVRSISDMERCYQQFCAENSVPFYVSMESGILAGYHNAPEHQFFLRKAGCSIKDIEKSQNEADEMLVINDNGRFDAGKSGYRELSLFGKYTLGSTKQCSENLSIQVIQRPAANTGETIFTPQ